MSIENAQTWRKLSVDQYENVASMLRENIADEAWFTLRGDASDDEVKAYWFGGLDNEFWVLEEADQILGAFYQRCNQFGLGSHVANGGYVVASEAKNRGIGRKLGVKSIERARERGFRGIQFNFVVAPNTVAVKLWRSLGFVTIGTIPGGYHYKQTRYDDAYIMFKDLTV